ncbi:hypothetical protein HYY69_04005 [Candidatus Woesearchaeota archaeon]|nr:hypothetical protein [Candidatus Woesearchaeota archaeon]
MNRKDLSDLIRTIESQVIAADQAVVVSMYFDNLSPQEFLGYYDIVVSFILDLASVTLQESREALEEEAEQHVQRGRYLHYYGRDLHKRTIVEGFRPQPHLSAGSAEQVISLLQYSSPIPGHAAHALRVFNIVPGLASHLYTVSYVRTFPLSKDQNLLPLYFTLAGLPPQRMLTQLNEGGWELYHQQRADVLGVLDHQAIRNGPVDILEEDKPYLVLPSTDQPTNPDTILRNPRRFAMTTRLKGKQYLNHILFNHGRVYLRIGRETVVIPLHKIEQTLQERVIHEDYQQLH